MSIKLHPYCTSEQIAVLLHAACDGQPLQWREIERQVERSAEFLRKPDRGRGAKHTPRWPKIDEKLRQTVVSSSPGLEELQASTTVPFGSDEQYTSRVLEILFPGNPLLCGGLNNRQFTTRSLSEWTLYEHMHEIQFIVPSPMAKKEGVTQDGKRSAHCLDNTGPRRYLVCEFDQGTPDEQARTLVHLGKQAPLAMVVHSGGKSLHGWFHCPGVDEGRLREFFGQAVSLGADHHTWTRSQFVRMPGAMRDNGQRQHVMFFNPEVIR